MLSKPFWMLLVSLVVCCVLNVFFFCLSMCLSVVLSPVVVVRAKHKWILSSNSNAFPENRSHDESNGLLTRPSVVFFFLLRFGWPSGDYSSLLLLGNLIRKGCPGFTTIFGPSLLSFYYASGLINGFLFNRTASLMLKWIENYLSHKVQPESLAIGNPFLVFVCACLLIMCSYFYRWCSLSVGFVAAPVKNIVFNSFDVAFVVLFSSVLFFSISPLLFYVFQFVTFTIISDNRQK